MASPLTLLVPHVLRPSSPITLYFPCVLLRLALQPATPPRTVSMPDDVETELYQHVVWMCENGYPVSWENIKAVAWQLGKICHMQGKGFSDSEGRII